MFYILPNVNYGKDLNMSIPGAPDFKYGNFVSSEIAIRNGIANIPDAATWLKIEALAVDILQPLRNKLGPIGINSGYRCEALNTLAKSTNASFHRTGGGADLHPYNCSLMTLLEEAMKLPISECIAEYFPNGWVHIGYLKNNSARALKLKDATHNYVRIELGALKALYKNV